MSSLLSDLQTSGNFWRSHGTEELILPYQEKPENEISGSRLLDFAALESQMARFESDHADLTNRIRRAYVIEDEGTANSFFTAHRQIPELLIEALPHLRNEFETSLFSLRVSGEEDGWQSMYVDVLWDGDASDASAKIDTFEGAWWLTRSHLASTSLTFTYRLI